MVEIRTASRKEVVWVSPKIAATLRLIVASGGIKSIMQMPHSKGLAIINWRLTEAINVEADPDIETEADLLFCDEDEHRRRRHKVPKAGP